jgi:hypothetical protein
MSSPREKQPRMDKANFYNHGQISTEKGKN